MKLLKLSIWMLLVGVLISCSDDDVNTTSPESLLGTWKNISYTLEGTSKQTFNDGIPDVEADISGTSINSTQTLVFNDNPKTYKTTGTISMVFESRVFGQVVSTDTLENFAAINNGNWELNGNTLTLSDNNGEVSADIITLTDNRLVLRANIQREEESPAGATSIDQDVDMTFVR